MRRMSSQIRHLWHQVTMMMRPPGPHTRASSPTKRCLSGMCSPLSRLQIRSKDPSWNGCCSASATCGSSAPPSAPECNVHWVFLLLTKRDRH